MVLTEIYFFDKTDIVTGGSRSFWLKWPESIESRWVGRISDEKQQTFANIYLCKALFFCIRFNRPKTISDTKVYLIWFILHQFWLPKGLFWYSPILDREATQRVDPVRPGRLDKRWRRRIKIPKVSLFLESTILMIYIEV